MNEPMIDIHDLRLRAGERDLVRDLTVRMVAGERWVVVGPNGAGKSSLLGALAGARRAQGGSIRIAGRPIARSDVEELAELRALMNDRWIDPFSASVLDTVQTARYRFGAENGTRDVALAALSEMDCAHLALRDIRGLSRGERQRVALATALAQQTPVLLLDEPTSHQDPGHQAWVLARLAAREQQTIIAVLHDINAAARFATHVLLLSGDGWWRAGRRSDVLTAQELSTLFDARIEVTAAGRGEVFWVEQDP
ncbi:MAG TPA: ABC transporter ATP-binding protein [Burkholderiaceae bacterium]|nr:ABC transporter ATP-binding protein [Burkholderiaceae bacterium]